MIFRKTIESYQKKLVNRFCVIYRENNTIWEINRSSSASWKQHPLPRQPRAFLHRGDIQKLLNNLSPPPDALRASGGIAAPTSSSALPRRATRRNKALDPMALACMRLRRRRLRSTGQRPVRRHRTLGRIRRAMAAIGQKPSQAGHWNGRGGRQHHIGKLTLSTLRSASSHRSYAKFSIRPKRSCRSPSFARDCIG
jgi:hypothetical protein